MARRFLLLVAFSLLPVAPAEAASPKTRSEGVRFRADATKAWPSEWADVSCESDSRVSRVKNPVAKGRRAYRVRLQEGDESYGERCELGMANTSSVNIDRVGG